MCKKLIKKTTISLITLTIFAASSMAISAETKMEKCTGIVKAGKADGQTIVDGEKVDWILVPVGACMKFVGGKVVFEK